MHICNYANYQLCIYVYQLNWNRNHFILKSS